MERLPHLVRMPAHPGPGPYRSARRGRSPRRVVSAILWSAVVLLGGGTAFGMPHPAPPAAAAAGTDAPAISPRWAERAGLAEPPAGPPAAPRDGAAGTPAPPAGSPGSPGSPGCPPPDLSVPHPYALSGFWVFPRTDRCRVRETLQAIHRVGGDTVIQFGPTLRPRAADRDGRIVTPDGVLDPAFAGCAIGGITCVAATAAELRDRHRDNVLAGVDVYDSTQRFGPALLRCPGLDRSVVAGDKVFYLLVLPEAEPDRPTCQFDRGERYHLVVVRGPAVDALGVLLDEADLFGMAVYAPLPTAARDPDRRWLPDLSRLPVLVALTGRVVDDYALRYTRHPSFQGVYQTFETPLQRFDRPTRTPVLTLYGAQHERVRASLPGRRILVSPYWDARRGRRFSSTPEQAADGFAALARTGADIIAPQDSRGTGKVGLYWEYQASSPVDPRLRPVGAVGRRTYGAAYTGSTAAFYRAVARARTELAAQGRPVELWANLEAFEPTPARCAGAPVYRTDKARMDQALTFAGSYASKVISFMWDSRYTCGSSTAASLQEEIEADWDRPVLIGAARHSSGGRDGIVIRGYQMSSAIVTLTWYDRSWKARTTTIEVARSGHHDQGAGVRSDALPDAVEEIWVPFSWDGLARDFWLRIGVRNGTGKQATHTYSLGY